MRFVTTLTTALFLALLAIVPATAATVSLETSADAWGLSSYYNEDWNADTNYGAQTDAYGTVMMTDWRNNDGIEEHKCWTKFDLSSFVGPADSVTLEVTRKSTTPANDKILVYALNDGDAGEGWGEYTITYNNAPGNVLAANEFDMTRYTYLGALDYDAVGATGDVMTLSGAALQQAVNDDTDGQLTLGYLKRMYSNSGANFYSRESAAYAGATLVMDVPEETNLGRGRQLLLEQGLQIQSLVNPNSPWFTDVSLWQSANFTNFNFWRWQSPGVLAALPAGQQWSRLYDTEIPATKYLSSNELPYADSLTMYMYEDEMSDAEISNPARLSDMAATYAQWRELYPNAMVGSNFTGTMPNDANLANYMQVTQPDFLSFDSYPGDYDFSETERDRWYTAMQRFRTAAMGGNDGTGTTPLAYGQFLRLYRTELTIEPLPTESFVRLQQNASWAFGYTFVDAYTYNSVSTTGEGSYAVMFATANDSTPTAVFDYVKETNRQSRNLGPALVRLASTDIRMIRGSAYTTLPESIVRWGYTDTNSNSVKWLNQHTADTGDYEDYITSIMPTASEGGALDESYGDILIGYLVPLLDDNSGYTFVDGLHFMIVNGSVGPGTSGAVPVDANGVPDPVAMAAGTAEALAQWYHIAFDFGGSDFDSLVRLSRDTGMVELVTLTSTGGSTYAFDLNLPGGTGDLFAFWDSSDPLPSISGPQSLPGDADGNGTVDEADAAILAANWQKIGGATWADGDFNGDGTVNDIDATIMAANWQKTSQSASVPEPSSLVLLLGILAMAAFCKRAR